MIAMETNKQKFLKLVTSTDKDYAKDLERRIRWRKLRIIKSRIILKWLIFKDRFK